MNARRLLIYQLSATSDGHRGHYLAFFQQLFPAQVTLRFGAALASRNAVLVPMVEESFARYCAIASLRALIGRRTCGLLFRPRPALAPASLRAWIKRQLLRVLLRLPGVTTLTILPFSVEPRLSEIANGWIYDPQLWDLHQAGAAGIPPQPSPLVVRIREAAGARVLVIAVGRQDRDKGFDRFVSLWTESAALRERCLFAFGGKVDPALSGLVDAFTAAGGFALDRFVDDAELFDLYAAADLVWCVFARGYDQASGIMGRASQLGLPVLVRRGSLIARLCELEDLPHLAIGDDQGGDAFTELPSGMGLQIARDRAGLHGAVSLQRLREAFGWA